jgi:large subunit ribosomal protein L17
MISLIEREKITTTQVRAKTLSSSMEKLVTRARMNNDIATKRIITARLGNHRSAAKKLIEDIAPRYEKRLGGYTRVVKLPRRQGDAAQMAIIEFV